MNQSLKPDVVDHSAIYDRIEASEQRIFGTLKWFAGIGVTVIVAWSALAVGSSNNQVELNRKSAEEYGRSEATHNLVLQRMEDLKLLVIQNRADIQSIVRQHIDNDDVHHRATDHSRTQAMEH